MWYLHVQVHNIKTTGFIDNEEISVKYLSVAVGFGDSQFCFLLVLECGGPDGNKRQRVKYMCNLMSVLYCEYIDDALLCALECPYVCLRFWLYSLPLTLEVLNGIRIYFNFMLKDHLLYAQESDQYQQVISQAAVGKGSDRDSGTEREKGVVPSAVYGVEHLLRLFGEWTSSCPFLSWVSHVPMLSYFLQWKCHSSFLVPSSPPVMFTYYINTSRRF